MAASSWDGTLFPPGKKLYIIFIVFNYRQLCFFFLKKINNYIISLLFNS